MYTEIKYEHDITDGDRVVPGHPGGLGMITVLLARTVRSIGAQVRRVRRFGVINTARAHLSSPLFHLRRLVGGARRLQHLKAPGVLALTSLALSRPGQQVLRQVGRWLSRNAGRVTSAVSRLSVSGRVPTSVLTAAHKALQVVVQAAMPVRAGLRWARASLGRVGMTAGRVSAACAAAAVGKIGVPFVPAVPMTVVLLFAVTLIGALVNRNTIVPVGDGPDLPPSGAALDADVARAAMLHLTQLLPEVRTAVRDAVAAGDREALRDARRLLSDCRSRAGELRKAAEGLRAQFDGDALPEDLAEVLSELDSLVEAMRAQWTELGQQLRDAEGSRSDRRAAASKARRQWSPTAAQAL